MLNYKKTAFWIIMVSIVACIIIGICFLTNPKVKADAEENTTENMEENIMESIEVCSPEPAVKPYDEDPDIGVKTYEYQPVVTFDDLNDTDYVFAWRKVRFNNIMLKSYHHLENDPEKRVSLGKRAGIRGSSSAEMKAT